jgi:hypothetical protein
MSNGIDEHLIESMAYCLKGSEMPLEQAYNELVPRYERAIEQTGNPDAVKALVFAKLARRSTYK